MKCSMDLPLLIFLFLLTGSTAVMGNGAVAQNCPYVCEPKSENDDLVEKLVTRLVESLQPILLQAMGKKLEARNVLELGAKIDKLIEKEEETAKQVQEIQLQQLRDSSKLEKITSSLSESTNVILRQTFANVEWLQEETSKTFTNVSKGTENKISQKMDATNKNIQEVNDKLTKLKGTEKKEKEEFSAIMQNLEQKVDIEIIPAMAEISKQLSHVNESIMCEKSSSDDNQKQIYASVTLLVKEVKELATEMGNIKKDVMDSSNKLQVMESKLSKEVTTVGNNIVTAVTKAESEIGTKLSDITSEDRNDIKSFIYDNCGLKSMSGLSNCAEIQRSGRNISGIYTIAISSVPLQVYCDMETDGGGWTVIQRRDDVTPHIDFYRYWADYKGGFGDLKKEFWLGLDSIYALTSRQSMSLRVDLEDFEGNKKFAFYRKFSIGDEWEKYRLSIEGFEGDAGDSMVYHNGQAFSTRDRDNDVWVNHCVEKFLGAWWHRDCHHVNLNGKYLRGETKSYADGINWYHFKGHHYSLKKTEMKIRPTNF